MRERTKKRRGPRLAARATKEGQRRERQESSRESAPLAPLSRDSRPHRWRRPRAALSLRAPMPLTRRQFVVTSRDPKETSDDAFDNALLGTILGVDGCDGLLFQRWVNRSLQKAVRALAGEYPMFTRGDIEQLVGQAAENLTLKARKGKLEPVENPTGLLYVSAKNLVRDRLRRRKGKERLVGTFQGDSVDTTQRFFIEAIDPTVPRPDIVAARQELRRRVGEQVGGLPAQQRAVVCAFREGMDYPEIAAMLSLTESTIRVHFHDAAAALRRLVDPKQLEATLPEGYRQRIRTRAELEALASPSGPYQRLFSLIHVEGGRISEACRILGVGRALGEAVLLQGYWRIRHATGSPFPTSFLGLLPNHRHYAKHACPFRLW